MHHFNSDQHLVVMSTEHQCVYSGLLQSRYKTSVYAAGSSTLLGKDLVNSPIRIGHMLNADNQGRHIMEGGGGGGGSCPSICFGL